ncbi:hypothetical protein MY3296_004465 [Beauveria thailandica]
MSSRNLKEVPNLLKFLEDLVDPTYS